MNVKLSRKTEIACFCMYSSNLQIYLQQYVYICICVYCVYIHIYIFFLIFIIYLKTISSVHSRMLLCCAQRSVHYIYFAVLSRERKPVIMRLKLKSVSQKLSVRDSDCGALEETCRRRSGIIRSLSRATSRVHGQAITRLRSAAFICSLKVTQKSSCSPGTTQTHREAQRPAFIDVTPHTFPWRIVQSRYERCISFCLVEGYIYMSAKLVIVRAAMN